MEESRREAPEVITGSAPFDHALEPLPGLSFTPLEFDPREFMHLVESEGLTEEEATLLLRAIWDVMVSFLDLHLGIHPIIQVVDRSDRKSSTPRQTPRSMLSSQKASSRNANRRSAVQSGRTRGDS